MNKIVVLLSVLLLTLQSSLLAQIKMADSTAHKKIAQAPYKPGFRDIFHKVDTSKPYSPRIAVLRSAIIPGWGQATNKKLWKIPLVYGALGITAGVFFHNVKQYKESRDAYINAVDGDTSNNYLIPEPYHSVLNNPQRIRTFRNQVRQSVDYSVLFFIAFWGLNVADAAVDAHLKTFDVSNDLSLEFKPGYSPMANTNGVSLILHIGDKKVK